VIARFEVHEPDKTLFTATITMSLEDWLKIKDVASESPSDACCGLVRLIREMVYKAKMDFLEVKQL